MFTIFRECPTAGPCQLDRHLQDGLYHRDPVREVGLLRPQREVQASAHKLRRREDQEGGLVCLQLWSKVSPGGSIMTSSMNL